MQDSKLLTCSDDKTVIIWKKNKNNYFEVEKKITTSVNEYPNTNMVLIDNLLLCSSISDEDLKFFDVKNDYKLMFSFNNVKCCFSRNSIIYIKEKDLLLVGGTNNNGIYLFKLQKIPYFVGKFFPEIINCVYSIILLDNDNILVGLEEKLANEDVNSIFKFKIDKDNKLINVNKMSNTHQKLINGLIDWKEKKLIVSCSQDSKVKLWKIMKNEN